MAEISPSFHARTLGKPQAWFPVNNWNRIGNLLMALLMLVGSCLVFLYGIYDASVAVRKHGLAVLEDKLFFPLVIAGAMLLLGSLGGWGAYVNWNKGISVHEKGFALHTRHGVQIWKWEDITFFWTASARLYYGIYIGTLHKYFLRDKQGRRLVLSNLFKDVEKLSRLIEQAIFSRLYEQAADQYNQGQKVVFGPLVVSKAGIQIGKKYFPWQEVSRVTVQQGILKISKKGKWLGGASTSISAIPNVQVLLSILDQLVGVKIG
jgi:hypothetical protein